MSWKTGHARIRATARRKDRWSRQCSPISICTMFWICGFTGSGAGRFPRERHSSRYADDFVLGFQYKRDAERFVRDLRERMASFGLEVHPGKTRLVEFGRFAAANYKQRRQGRPGTFDFLGFTHYCTTTRRGQFQLGRKPMSKRVSRTLKRIAGVLRRRWHDDIWVVGRWLGRVVNGWLNYYAVPGSGRFIRGFARSLLRLWHRALRRRSQRDRFAWKKIERMKELLWPPVTAPSMAKPTVCRHTPEVCPSGHAGI